MIRNNDNNPKLALKTLKVLHSAFCLSILVFSVVVYFVTDDHSFFNTEGMNALYYGIPILAVLLIYGSKGVYANALSKIPNDMPLEQKISNYSTANIIRYAMIEGPAFLCVAVSFMSGSLLFLIIALCILLYLYSIKPTKAKLIEDLNLNFEERKQF